MREQLHRSSRSLALCAMMTALGTALMCAGGLIPIATYAVPMYVAVLLVPVLYECSAREGWMVWASTTLLSLMLAPDREAVAVYFFFGCYPMLRPWFWRIRPKWLSQLIKVLWFSLEQAVMYILLIYLFQMQDVAEELLADGIWMTGVLFVLFVAVFMVFDRVYEGFTTLYPKRIRPRLPGFVRNREKSENGE